MTIRQGDRAPDAMPITIATGTIDGTDVARVRLVIKPPTSAVIEVDLTPTASSVTSVSCLYPFEADGSSWPDTGQYRVGAWLYDGGDVLLGHADEQLMPERVEPRHVPLPT